MSSGFERDYLFDNIKAVLIFFVTLVHLMAAVREVYGNHPITDFIMMIICAFHMPLFMFISGYFSKRDNPAKLANLVVTYLVIQGLFLIFDLTFMKQSLSDYSITKFLFPGFSMWYLFALITIKFVLPVLERSRNHLVTTVVLAIVSILVMGSSMKGNIETTIVKTLANAIYFWLGYKCQPEYIERIRKIPKLVHIGGATAGALVLYYCVSHSSLKMNQLRILMLRANNIDNIGWGDHALKGYILFACILAFAIFISITAIGMAPRKKLIISRYGMNSLTIYIGQAFGYLVFREFCRATEIASLKSAYLIALAASVVIVVVLGSNIVCTYYKKLNSAVNKLLFIPYSK